jgi:hypothetical protein
MQQRPTEFYPWMVDWSIVIGIVIVGLASVLAVYLAMRQGRLERTNKDTAGKPPIHEYAGVAGSDSNRITLFLVLLIVGLLIWGVGYVVNISIHGLGY